MSVCVAAVVAHPDDESLIAGGTLALAAQAGKTAAAVALTRGELGPISDPALATHDTLGQVRAEELAAAGEVLGLAWTAALRHPDGQLSWTNHEAVAAEVAELLGRCDEVALLTFGQDGLYGHADHMASGQIARIAAERLGTTRCGVYEAAWPAGLVSTLVAEAKARGLSADLWGIEPEAFGSAVEPTLVVDVRPVLEVKLAALRAHRTQLGRDHLLAALPHDLAERFLGEERWRRVGGAEVLGG